MAAIQAANRWARHVQIGQLAGLEIALPAPALRSVSLDLLGYSIAHPPADVKREGFLELTGRVARGEIAVDLETFPLADVATAWDRQRHAAGGPKLVLLP